MAIRVLIVDDSPNMRQLLAGAVRAQGDVELAEATDGLDALKRLATASFDILFTDVNMPLLDGLKLVRRVRSDPAHQGMKICVCTTEAECEAQARALGADHFLCKPVAPAQVAEVLRLCFPGRG